MRLEFTIPLRTAPGQNAREHWAVKAKRVRRERNTVKMLWPGRGKAWTFPVLVTLTRISPGRALDSHDNLPGALKAIVDQVAQQLGVDDGDTERVRFAYAQQRGPWGVRVGVEETARDQVDHHRQASEATGEIVAAVLEKARLITAPGNTPPGAPKLRLSPAYRAARGGR